MGILFSSEPKQEQEPKGLGNSPIIEAKSFLSNGDKTGAFAVLKKGAENGDVMACYDAGFMMIQGIGCDEDWKGGLELISKGVELENKSSDMSWKSDGSASELFEPQIMYLSGLFFDEYGFG